MKTNLKLRSVLFSMLALLAVSTLSLTLSSCGDDDDDTPPVKKANLYQQWVSDDVEGTFGPTASKYFSKVAIDLTENGKISMLLLSKEDSKWYTAEEQTYKVINQTETNGKLQLEEIVIEYEIIGDKLVATFDSDGDKNTFILTATSGIKSAGSLNL